MLIKNEIKKTNFRERLVSNREKKLKLATNDKMMILLRISNFIFVFLKKKKLKEAKERMKQIERKKEMKFETFSFFLDSKLKNQIKFLQFFLFIF